MNLIASLVAFALVGAPISGGAEGPGGPAEKPGRAIASAPASAPTNQVGFFVGFALDGTHFHVGGEWTRSKPFYVEVPLNSLCYVRVFVARTDGREPDGSAVASSGSP